MFWFQERLTLLTLIKILTSIGGHILLLLMFAHRAGDD